MSATKGGGKAAGVTYQTCIEQGSDRCWLDARCMQRRGDRERQKETREGRGDTGRQGKTNGQWGWLWDYGAAQEQIAQDQKRRGGGDGESHCEKGAARGGTVGFNIHGGVKV